MNRPARLLIGLLVIGLALPAFAQVTDRDIDRARAEVNRIIEESAELGSAVIDAYGQQAALDQEIQDLRSSIEYAQIQIAETEVRLEELAVQLYMGSTSGVSLSMLFSTSDQGYPAGMEYLREVTGVDASVVDQLRVFRTELNRQTERLGEALAEQQTLATELETLAGQLQEDLVAAQAVYDQLVEQQRLEELERLRLEEERRLRAEEEARQAAAAQTSTTQATPRTTSAPSPTTPTTAAATTITTAPSAPTTTASPAPTTAPSPPPPSPGGGGTCPVAGAVTFSDTWGAPRSGGRPHLGVDMIAARGTPIVAIFSGTIYRTSNSSLGGLSVYLTSDAGDMYYYAHLDSFGDISAGQRVAEGYVIGYNGSTGNAPSWLPHLHFEYHPGGGAAVNPYPLVKSICG